MRTLHAKRWPAAVALLLGFVCGVYAEPAAAAPSTTVTSTTAATETARAETDPQAALFMMKCAGCHAISGPKLAGPSLAPVTGWKRADLLLNIKRMEKNVGLVPEGELGQFADFLQSATAEPRLQAERERLAKKLMAKMAPPSAAEGARLFHGQTRLHGGGPACVACHTVQAEVDMLGPRLGAALKRMGDMAFISFVENANSAVMNPIYKRHPLTKQEALHLAAYVKQPGVESAGAPVGWLGALGAALFLGGMAVFARGRKASTRARLIQHATRSQDI